MTRNAFGAGKLTYEGTFVSDALQDKIVADCLAAAGIPLVDRGLPQGVQARHGLLGGGAAFHAYLNFSPAAREFVYGRESGRDILTGAAVAQGTRVALGPWGLIIVRAGL